MSSLARAPLHAMAYDLDSPGFCASDLKHFFLAPAINRLRKVPRCCLSGTYICGLMVRVDLSSAWRAGVGPPGFSGRLHEGPLSNIG